MGASIIDGKAFAAKLRGRVGQAVQQLNQDHNLTPGLAVVLVGEDPASQVYVRNKGKQTREAGMHSVEHKLDKNATEAQLLALIDQLNNDPAIHGILVQLPVPDHINEDKVIQAVAPAKDVDGFHLLNVGALAAGLPCLVPCTPSGSMMLLRDQLGALSGKHAVVIGRSHMVGRPVAQLLVHANCTVTIAHSRTADLPSIVRQADIVVAAVGRPEMVRGDWIKPGATIIDVGINRIDAPEKGEGKTRLVGDVCFDEAVQVAGAITPVPGGVGPMTIACLLDNAVRAACQQTGVPVPAVLEDNG